ncbi:MAG: M56 family metallopeptidase [Gemmatimonadota bacterium]|nr:M56 family metallopeptidase [Gemmatimonadota bacterium]
MIAAWMLWSIGAGLLSLVAGLAVERLLEGGRRWVWVGAGAATVLLPASRFLSGRGGADVVAPPTAAVRLEPLTVTVADNSVLHSLDDALLLGWLALSSVLVVGALVAAARFMWRRRGWEEGMLLGRRVLWSRDSGPAVVGLAMSSIVVPRWVAGAGRARQELVLAHEEEHLRARDAHLLLLAALLLFVFPWNPVLWIQYRRLGLAVELDCDRRVMRRWPTRRRLYGDLLLRVGTGGGALRAMGAAALAERPSLLERRIRALLSGAPEVRMAQAAFLGFCALLAVGVALMVPGIARERAEPEPEREPPAEADADLAERPVWTPRDTDPQYANREEIEAALAREYPPPLRDAGVGGRVVVWLLVDEAGKVRKTRIQAGSGHRGLDEAALRVADVARFSPALHRGRPVPVWIALPIVFGVR